MPARHILRWIIGCSACLIAGRALSVAADSRAPSHRSTDTTLAPPPTSVDTRIGPIAAEIDSQLSAAVTAGFGGAIIVEVNGKTLLRAGYGLADRAAARPFTSRTTAQLGSITKTFTALAVCQLAVQGRLDLNLPVGKYLPGAAEPGRSATLNELMTHTAGLDDYCGDDFERRTREEVLTDCMARPLKYAKGEAVYSNMGLSMAAATVELVTGRQWEEWLNERIWKPFGMTRTCWSSPGKLREELALGYLGDTVQVNIADRIAALDGADWNLKGNGGLQASAEDMQRFYHGLMAQPAGVRALMLNSHAPAAEADVKQGYGLFFRLDEAGRPYRLGHSGSDGVFYSYFAIFPEPKAFFYFVGNNGEEPAQRVMVAALRTLQDSLGVGPRKPGPHQR